MPPSEHVEVERASPPVRLLRRCDGLRSVRISCVNEAVIPAADAFLLIHRGEAGRALHRPATHPREERRVSGASNPMRRAHQRVGPSVVRCGQRRSHWLEGVDTTSRLPGLPQPLRDVPLLCRRGGPHSCVTNRHLGLPLRFSEGGTHRHAQVLSSSLDDYLRQGRRTPFL
jgi:hypothetical protein